MTRILSVLLRTLLVVLGAGVPMFLAGCGSGTPSATTSVPVVPAATNPSITAATALGGAQLITITNQLTGGIVFYTLDGSAPSSTSLQYLAPFLITQTTTVNAVAISATTQSSVSTQAYTLNIPSNTLVWSDDFTNTTNANIQPNPAIWTYDTGATGFGNQELQTYCAWGSNASPCSAATPNVYVGTDNALHIVAIQPVSGVFGNWTSARIKTQGLFSMSYGRLEARMMIPEGQGFWTGLWLMGNDFATVGWPICGEQDVVEHVNAPVPDSFVASVHMPGYGYSQSYSPTGYSAAGWHIYGMIWSKGSVQYYVDSPSNTVGPPFTPAIAASHGGTWPFDSGNANFILLNLAVGGTLPGSPNGTTTFPSQLVVDYVHLYTN